MNADLRIFAHFEKKLKDKVAIKSNELNDGKGLLANEFLKGFLKCWEKQ